MSQVLDYSLARPDPAAIAAAGYVGVMRYVAPAQDAPKVIYAPEYAALRAAGLQVGLNWEWYADRAREGAASGTADAQEALRQANALGYGGAIYFSVDYDAPPADQPAINAYFQACAQVIGLARLGCYAGYWPLSRLFDAGLIIYGWQTIAWSGGNRESRAHLYQTAQTAFNNGADVNDVLKDNWTGEVMAVPQGPFYKVTAGQNGVPASGNGVAAAMGLSWQDILAIPGQNPALANYDPTVPGLVGPGSFGQWILLPGFPLPAVPASAKLVIDSDSIRAVIA